MNCKDCTHFHDLGDKLMCDKGIMEVLIISGAAVKLEPIVIDCPEYGRITVTYGFDGCDKPAEVSVKVDKRSKAYKDSLK
jgi:hypothetical protein